MDQKTIAAYNQMARAYDEETAPFWDRFPRTFLDRFVALSGRNILDVGSGPGRDGLLLQKEGKEMTCIDASVAMVELSSERGLKSVVGDFTALPFPAETFDGAWSYTALLHVPKTLIDVSLDEIYRILKPQGILALGLIEGDTQEYRETSAVRMPRWFSFYSQKDIEDFLARRHFEVLYFESFKPGSRNYLNFIARK